MSVEVMRLTILRFLLPAMLLVALLTSWPQPAKALTNQELIAKIEELTQIVLALQAQIQARYGATVALPSTTFIHQVQPELTNDSIKLLQSVLATDSTIYPEGLVTGYFGPLTTAALSRFQQKFGLVTNGQFTAETSFVLSRALSGVPFVDNQSGYLTNSSVVSIIKQASIDFVSTQTAPKSPTITTPPLPSSVTATTDATTIRSVTITRNYQNDTTTVLVNYKNSPPKRLTINVTAPPEAVLAEVARQLGVSVSDISSRVVYDERGGKEISKIILTITLATKMHVDVILRDGTKVHHPITEDDIRDFIGYAYGGNDVRYYADFDYFVDKARKGESIDEVNKMVADLLGSTRAEVAAVMEYNVEPYDEQRQDSSTGGA